MTRRWTLLACATLALAAAPAAGDAQILDKLAKKAKKEIGKSVEREIDRPAPADTQPKAQPQTPAGKAPVDAVTPQGAPASAPGEGAWANYDFVPGERVLFFEDFARDVVGNFPRRLELVTGNMEIVEWQGTRWLRINSNGAFRVPLPEVLPERFTVEFDLTIPHGALAIYTGAAKGELAPTSLDDRALVLVSQFYKAGVVGPKRMPQALVYPRDVLPAPVFANARYAITTPVRVRVHVDGRYVKVYLEEHRVANVPNADLGRGNQLVIHAHASGKSQPLIANLSINAGGRRMYDALLADGRVVTRGILFDTGSDGLRPESTPTLKEIAGMLAEHPELRLRIEGHTDAVGDDAANLSLSQRRAAAVARFLVERHGVAAARLEAKGLGETRPAGSNETPEGRQQNRRVELVKL